MGVTRNAERISANCQPHENPDSVRSARGGGTSESIARRDPSSKPGAGFQSRSTLKSVRLNTFTSDNHLHHQPPTHNASYLFVWLPLEILERILLLLPPANILRMKEVGTTGETNDLWNAR